MPSVESLDSHIGDGPPPTLRPSVRESFPLFSLSVLARRLVDYSFPVATFLRYENVVAAAQLVSPQVLASFFEEPDDTQRAYLEATLIKGKITTATASAVSSVERRHFVAKHSYLPFANLNASIPYSLGSWLTPPYLVAEMIDRLNVSEGQDILEIGAGAGFHLACIAEKLGGRVQLYGIEINARYQSFGIPILRQQGYADCVTLMNGDGSSGWPDSSKTFDRIYCTAALRNPAEELPVHQLRVGGFLQCVRALSEQEFGSYPPRSTIRGLFPLYDDYLLGDWKQFCCISTYHKTAGELVETTRLFDVFFVPLYHSPQSDNRSEVTDPFSALRSFLPSLEGRLHDR